MERGLCGLNAGASGGLDLPINAPIAGGQTHLILRQGHLSNCHSVSGSTFRNPPRTCRCGNCNWWQRPETRTREVRESVVGPGDSSAQLPCAFSISLHSLCQLLANFSPLPPPPLYLLLSDKTGLQGSPFRILTLS